MRRFTDLYFLIALLIFCPLVSAAEQNVTLSLAKRVVHVDGRPTVAFAINESLNRTVLHFTEGDIATVTVENGLDQTVSFYWQGLAQGSDSTSFSTTLIPAMQRKTYAFGVMKAGTYRFFAQQGFAQQRGLQGVVVVKPRSPRMIHFDHDAVLQFTEWHDLRPSVVWSNLKKDADWYSRAEDGWQGIDTYLSKPDLGQWLQRRQYALEKNTRVGALGAALLVNGQQTLAMFNRAKPGEVVRLRLVNHGTQELLINSNVQAMTVIAADGSDVEPVSIQELRLAAGELYDVLMTVPETGLLRLAGSSHAAEQPIQVFVGPTPDLAGSANQYGYSSLVNDSKPVWPLASSGAARSIERGGALHRTHIIHADQPLVLDNSPVVIHPTVSAGLLQPTLPVSGRGDTKQLTIEIRGNLDQFRWALATKDLPEPVVEGDSVLLQLNNTTPLAQSIYLLGHRLSAVTEEGQYLAPKYVVLVPPLSQQQFQFRAGLAGDWLMASTNHFRTASGMQTSISIAPQHLDQDKEPIVTSLSLPSFRSRLIRVGNNTLSASHTLALAQQALMSTAELGGGHELRATLDYRMNQGTRGQWLLRGEHNDDGDTASQRMLVGYRYALPYSVVTELAWTSEQTLRFMLQSELQLSRRWRLSSAIATDAQWQSALSYQRSSQWSIALQASDISPLGLSATFLF